MAPAILRQYYEHHEMLLAAAILRKGAAARYDSLVRSLPLALYDGQS